MKPPMLSPRQKQLVAAVKRLTEAKGHAPAIRELAAEMELSAARVHELIRTAERRGAVTHVPRVARTVRVLRDPSDPR